MAETERRDEAGRRESDHGRTLDWVFNELIPELDKEKAAEAAPDSVKFVTPPIPEPRKLRIGDVVYDVFPAADE